MPACTACRQRVLPLEVWHTASVGIDLWLAAIAYGAAQVWVLVTHEEAPAYREAIDAQMKVAQAILTGLGFAASTFASSAPAKVSRSTEREVLSGPAPAARGRHHAGQRSGAAALDAALRRPAADDGSPRRDLRRPARQADDARPRLRALAARSADAGRRHRAAGDRPQRRARSARSSSTRAPAPCAWRASAPARKGALVDHPGFAAPQLHREELRPVRPVREHLPEDAITLVPRLLLADGGKARRQPRVLNEAEPFRCVRCASRSARCARSSRWSPSSPVTRCSRAAPPSGCRCAGDCRVIDLHSDPGEVRITEL
jgi:hypothetical protein